MKAPSLHTTKLILIMALSILHIYFFINVSIAKETVLPSCYKSYKAKTNIDIPIPEKEISVVIDQTTVLDENLKYNVMKKVSDLLKPGNSFVIGAFSAYQQDRYMELLYSGFFEPNIAKKLRGDIGVKVLKDFDTCLSRQIQVGKKYIADSLNKTITTKPLDLSKSDILSSLKEISKRVRNSKAKKQIIFLVSDMLENSSISSFYEKQNVRTIKVNEELNKVKNEFLFSDFGNDKQVKVYVFGAGLISFDNKRPSVYRDPKALKKLEEFWAKYFKESNAELVDFGKPNLMIDIE